MITFWFCFKLAKTTLAGIDVGMLACCNHLLLNFFKLMVSVWKPKQVTTDSVAMVAK